VSDSNSDDPKTGSKKKSKGDLTALGDLSVSESEFIQSPPSENQGIDMDDLLSPLSPTSTGMQGEPGSFTFSPDENSPDGDDAALEASMQAIENLSPIDDEVRRLAAGPDAGIGIEEDIMAPMLMDPDANEVPRASDTPVGEVIAGALAGSAPGSSMDAVRNYSDHVAAASSAETAETPYSLLIEGALRPHEKEALLHILSRENLGIREVELEPQFAAGHILIPRISEFAGVMIVQALRNSTARMRLGPSEKIYVSKQAEDGEERLVFPPNPDAEILHTEDGHAPSERVVLTPEDTVPGRKVLQAIDTLHSSMNLKAIHLAHPQSPLFQDAIERLKKALKFQAHHRGANALLNFKYELLPLEGQTVYKLIVQARAVRVENEA
jgi:hypothetical protein